MKNMRKWKKVIMVMAVIVMAMAMGVTASAASAKKTGFVRKAGKVYYYKKGKKVTGVVKINNKYYGFDKKGVRYKQGWQKIKGKHYFFNKYGVAATGMKKAWSDDGQGHRYPGYFLFSDKGVQYRRSHGQYTVKYKGKTVYLQLDNSVQDGAFYISTEYDGVYPRHVYVILDKDGTLRKPGWYKATNGWCYYVVGNGIPFYENEGYAMAGDKYVEFFDDGHIKEVFVSREAFLRTIQWRYPDSDKMDAVVANIKVIPAPNFEWPDTEHTPMNY